MKYKRYEDRETLERIKRWPQLSARFPLVRIYSNEHGAFWRGSGQGYTTREIESDVLSCYDAFEQTKHCGKEKHIQFVMALCEKNVDYNKMYKGWSGVSHIENSCQKTYDSADVIDFAEYCVKEVLAKIESEALRCEHQ